MDTTKQEVAAIEQLVKECKAEVQELHEIELALVGGGQGDVGLH